MRFYFFCCTFNLWSKVLSLIKAKINANLFGFVLTYSYLCTVEWDIASFSANILEMKRCASIL